MLLYVIVGLLLLANTINLGADLGAMAAALKLLVGGPASLSVVGFAVGCTWLEVFSPYQRYVSILKWGSFVLLAYVAVALVVDVPWKLVLYSTYSARPRHPAQDERTVEAFKKTSRTR